MDQTQIFQMQQQQYDRQQHHEAQVADLTQTFLHKRVKATEAGMRTRAHKEKYMGQTGVVNEILIGPVCGLEIHWEDGSTTQSLPYMVTLVEKR